MRVCACLYEYVYKEIFLLIPLSQKSPNSIEFLSFIESAAVSCRQAKAPFRSTTFNSTDFCIPSIIIIVLRPTCVSCSPTQDLEQLCALNSGSGRLTYTFLTVSPSDRVVDMLKEGKGGGKKKSMSALTISYSPLPGPWPAANFQTLKRRSARFARCCSFFVFFFSRWLSQCIQATEILVNELRHPSKQKSWRS